MRAAKAWFKENFDSNHREKSIRYWGKQEAVNFVKGSILRQKAILKAKAFLICLKRGIMKNLRTGHSWRLCTTSEKSG